MTAGFLNFNPKKFTDAIGHLEEDCMLDLASLGTHRVVEQAVDLAVDNTSIQATLRSLKEVLQSYSLTFARARFRGNASPTDRPELRKEIIQLTKHLSDEIHDHIEKAKALKREEQNQKIQWKQLGYSTFFSSAIAIVAAMIPLKCSESNVETRVRLLENKSNPTEEVPTLRVELKEGVGPN